jgi:aldehyde:ferredoxin oxidoreductase
MYGWMGKILRVNLTNGEISKEDLSPEIAKNFIGGRGIGIKYLYDEIDPKIDALSPKNKLLMVTGPLTGTAAPGGSRYMVVTKAPLTGAIANSNAGGFFPAELKFAGYDLIIFEGKAKKPVYLWIENDRVELRDAEEIWGRDTYTTQDMIRAETDDNAKVACIGPAGENLVRFACIINDDGRAAGRSGVGAVMGSKNLKAVAVRGTKGVVIADKDKFAKAVKVHLAGFKLHGAEWYDPWAGGTISLAMPFVSVAGALPTRNCQTGVFEGAEKLSGELFNATFSKRKNRPGVACFNCPLGCGQAGKVTDPEFACEGDGPEYESTGAFGSACGIDNLAAVAKASYICNEMGMDTITMGMTIACAMELFEKGYLPEKDVGMKLNFGNAKAMVELVQKTAYKEGFGSVLAEGSYRLAEKYKHPELSMSVKKQEFAMYEPRALQGLALTYATTNRGACHIRAEVHDVSVWGIYWYKMLKDRGITEPLDPLRWEDKPWACKEIQDWYASLIDSSGMCNFNVISSDYPEENICAMLEGATGVSFGGYEEMRKTGERIWNLERLFNLKAGLTGKDDTLPPRMLKEPMPEGPAKGHVVELDKMLPEYYRLRGWDENGVPTPEKLKELGLA